MLWQKEVESNLSSRRAVPDLRIRIIQIVDFPAGARSSSPRKPTASASAASSPGLAICRILSASSLKHPHLNNTLRTTQEQHYLVVLSFPTTAPARLRGNTRVYARNPEDFIVGKEVHIWEPWQDVFLSDGTTSPGDADELIAAPFPFLPSSFPQTPDDLRLADMALLCTRFVIMP